MVAMGHQFLFVIGIPNVLAPVIAAGMGGDEFFPVINHQMIGIDFGGELLGGVA